MKYFFISLAVLVLIVIAFMKGVSIANAQTAETDSPCSPESIVKAKNPDARLSHCRDHDWDGSTLLKKRLAEARNHPTEYAILFSDDQIHSTLLLSPIQPETAEIVRGIPIPEPVPTHK